MLCRLILVLVAIPLCLGVPSISGIWNRQKTNSPAWQCSNQVNNVVLPTTNITVFQYNNLVVLSVNSVLQNNNFTISGNYNYYDYVNYFAEIGSDNTLNVYAGIGEESNIAKVDVSINSNTQVSVQVFNGNMFCAGSYEKTYSCAAGYPAIQGYWSQTSQTSPCSGVIPPGFTVLQCGSDGVILSNQVSETPIYARITTNGQFTAWAVSNGLPLQCNGSVASNTLTLVCEAVCKATYTLVQSF